MQIGEAIVATAVSHDPKSKCWYCEESPKEPGKKNDEDARPDTSDNESEDTVPENDVNNKSSTLGVNLGDKPSWTIVCPDTGKDTAVLAAAHHCIPGNASLKKAKSLHPFMREGGRLKLSSDIGYGVNHAKNGVWLPGNYGVRVGKEHYKKNWGSYDEPFKNEYAKRAMIKSKLQFHDAHQDYSLNVLNTLEGIAAKLGKPQDKCPICKKTFDKTQPPYGLVGRLDHVSEKHCDMISNLSKEDGKKFAAANYFTSSRVKKFFGLD